MIAAIPLLICTVLGPAPVELEVFTRDACPRCAAAHAYLDRLQLERPGLRVTYRSLDREPQALLELERLTADAGIATPGVPTFRSGDRLLVGFLDETSSAPRLLTLIEGGAAEPGEGGSCEAEAVAPTCGMPEESVAAPILGTLSVERLGLPLFTLALGLLDGFNPCAMWVLLFLLAMLVNLRDRRRMALIAGTFVAVSGVMYFAFMSAWLNVFLLIGMSAAVRIALGVVALGVGALNVKEFFAFKRGPSLTIPEAAKPGIYQRVRRVISAENLAGAMLAVTVLAILVNFVELLCTAGLPAVYTAVLAGQDISGAQRYAYLGLYNLAYVADDSLMVGLAVATLGRRKLQEKEGRWLKLLGGTVMLVLALGLLFFPELMF